jgi:hypothetical protein
MPILGLRSSAARSLGHFGGATPDLGAWVAIATVTGNGSASTLTFDNIPQNYRDLQVRGIMKTTGTSKKSIATDMRFNNVSTNSYSRRGFSRSGSTVVFSAATANSSTQIGSSPDSSSDFLNRHLVVMIDVYNYSSSDYFKTTMSTTGSVADSTAGTVNVFSGFYSANTNAITRLDLFASESFTTTTELTLYGIKDS